MATKFNKFFYIRTVHLDECTCDCLKNSIKIYTKIYTKIVPTILTKCNFSKHR